MSDLLDTFSAKIPPQAIEIEEAILGALLLESDSIHSVASTIKAEYFYKSQHEVIYKAIIKLYGTSVPIDILTVTEELRKSKELELVGGPYAVTELTSKVNSAQHLDAHCKIIIEKWLKRETIKIASQAVTNAYDDSIDPFDLLNVSTGELMNIVEDVTKGKDHTFAGLLDESMGEIVDRANSDEKLIGLPTGLAALDKITAGLQAPDLIIVGARPGMGKTAFAVQIASYVSKCKFPAAIFSLEMSAKQLTKRLQSSEAEISLSRILRGDVSDHEIMSLQFISDKLKNNLLYIDDTAGLTIMELRAKCHIMKHKFGIRLFLLDYIQLMNYGNKQREEGIGLISKGIKAIAKELDICFIALSQLSRKVEERGGDKRPSLSDLRESGSLEQDADAVWFLYRPEYYGITTDGAGNDVRGITEVIIAKHRQGALDTILLKFKGMFVKFTDYISGVGETASTLFDNNQEPEEDTPF